MQPYMGLSRLSRAADHGTARCAVECGESADWHCRIRLAGTAAPRCVSEQTAQPRVCGPSPKARNFSRDMVAETQALVLREGVLMTEWSGQAANLQQPQAFSDLVDPTTPGFSPSAQGHLPLVGGAPRGGGPQSELCNREAECAAL